MLQKFEEILSPRREQICYTTLKTVLFYQNVKCLSKPSLFERIRVHIDGMDWKRHPSAYI